MKLCLAPRPSAFAVKMGCYLPIIAQRNINLIFGITKLRSSPLSILQFPTGVKPQECWTVSLDNSNKI